MAFSYPIRNARLFFHNWSGSPDRYNKKGQMPNIAVIIPEEDVGYFKDDLGFDVKTKALEDGGYFYFLKVKVGKYADVYVRDADSMMHKISADPEMNELGNLAGMRFNKIDMSIVARDWDNGDKRGRSAYLKEFFGEEAPHSDMYREWINPDPTIGNDD